MIRLEPRHTHILKTVAFLCSLSGPWSKRFWLCGMRTTNVQSDQRLCCSRSGNYGSRTCSMQNFSVLTSPRSWSDWFEPDLVINPECSFSCDEARPVKDTQWDKYRLMFTENFEAVMVLVRWYNYDTFDVHNEICPLLLIGKIMWQRMKNSTNEYRFPAKSHFFCHEIFNTFRNFHEGFISFKKSSRNHSSVHWCG